MRQRGLPHPRWQRTTREEPLRVQIGRPVVIVVVRLLLALAAKAEQMEVRDVGERGGTQLLLQRSVIVHVRKG